MCHMLADTPRELHAMADRIGIQRKWYQWNASTPHYDICKSKRALAVTAGAIEVDRRGLAEVILKIRGKRLNSNNEAWVRDIRKYRMLGESK